jgi:Zn-dependent protease
MDSWWVYSLWSAGLVALLVSHLFWAVLSIVLHELAHGWAALWQGDPTPRQLGHMTANPMVHMGPWSIAALLFLGFAWGAMPVDPSRFRWGRRGRIVVAAAGPMMNVALMLACALGMLLWLAWGPRGEPLFSNMAAFFFAGAELNLVLAIFNLLPIPPLDGFEMLRGSSMRAYAWLHHHPQAAMFGMFFLLALMLTGALRIVWFAAGVAIRLAVQIAGGWMGLGALDPSIVLGA